LPRGMRAGWTISAATTLRAAQNTIAIVAGLPVERFDPRPRYRGNGSEFNCQGPQRKANEIRDRRDLLRGMDSRLRGNDNPAV
jgi:hypothetical protein